MTDDEQPVLDQRIWSSVRRSIAEGLALSEAEIKLESRLVDDLGADSLDFVDITFTLGRELGIDIRESEFNFLTRLDFSSPDVMREGVLTPAVVERLATWLPEIRQLPAASVSPARMFSLITARSIYLAVARQVG